MTLPPAVPIAHVDLHTHSTASDGSRAPADVVACAGAAGVVALALTDHDSLGGVAEAITAGAQHRVRVIAGVELSAFDDRGEIHILGLHIERVAELENACAAFRDTRRDRAGQIVSALNGMGVPITIEQVLHEATGAIGRPHVARALVAGGWAKDFREAFDRFLGAGRPAFVEKHRLSIVEAISLIHDTGGIAVWAHPGSDAEGERLAGMMRAGLDGLEVLHPGHASDESVRLDGLVTELGLVPSGGSDWHGASQGPRILGSQRVPAAWLALQDARVAERRARRVA